MNIVNETQIDEAWDSYFYPNTNVLKNKFNITNYDELRDKDSEISFERLVELEENPIEGNFDKEHLCAIHKYLFGDLYDWAGEFRYVNMKKKETFVNYEEIPKRLDIELALMNQEINDVTSVGMFACLLTRYFCELLIIHPFREGNGRCIREFLSEFVRVKSPSLPSGAMEIDWSVMNFDEMLERIDFIRVYPSFYEMQFTKALVPVDLEDNKIKSY